MVLMNDERGRRRATPSVGRRRSKIRIMIVVVSCVAAAGVVLWLLGRALACRAPTWSTGDPHNELIGVSYGDILFNDPAAERDPTKKAAMERINEIQARIYAENKLVAKQYEEQDEAYAKVALVMPLTVSSRRESAIPLEQIGNALEGLYTALVRVNHTTYYGDPAKVRLQLVLINDGSRQDVSERLVGKILGTSEDEHPLLAVVGLGSSVPNTKVLAERLAKEDLPMVSAITSADALTGLKDLWSVSPDNTQYVAALRHYLDGQKKLKSAIVVRDMNKDPYTNSLAHDFESGLKPYIKFPALSYNGGTVDQPIKSNVFAQVVNSLCVATYDPKHPLDTVLYAGRVSDFHFFAEALEKRTCRSTPMTVLNAATGFDTAHKSLDTRKSGNVTVRYASSSDAPTWLDHPESSPPDFRDFLESYQEQGFPRRDLDDGLAIAHHDALATAAMAIRHSSALKPADVAGAFPNLVLELSVRGALGRLTFPQHGRGRVLDRAIPIRRLG